MHTAGSSKEEVPYCFSRSSVKFQGHTALKSAEFDPDWAFLNCNSSLNSPMATKWCTKLQVALKRCPIVFSCDQAALWMVQSVRPSVCLSHLFDYVPIILSSWNFQELLPVTKVTSMQKVKVRGQRSRSQRSQPNFTVSGLQFEFTYDDEMMHIHCSFIMLRRGALLFFKVICQISRSHGSKNCRIWPRLGVSGL